jgi:hypothetical protein
MMALQIVKLPASIKNVNQPRLYGLVKAAVYLHGIACAIVGYYDPQFHY